MNILKGREMPKRAVLTLTLSLAGMAAVVMGTRGNAEDTLKGGAAETPVRSPEVVENPYNRIRRLGTEYGQALVEKSIIEGRLDQARRNPEENAGRIAELETQLADQNATLRRVAAQAIAQVEALPGDRAKQRGMQILHAARDQAIDAAVENTPQSSTAAATTSSSTTPTTAPPAGPYINNSGQ